MKEKVIQYQPDASKEFLRIKQSYFHAIFYGFTIMVIAGIIIYLSVQIAGEHERIHNGHHKMLEIL